MDSELDLAGIGIGPFNLSLAALGSGLPEIRSRFFESKERFEWHSELCFADATMQTTFLKDLVTPVDPTSPHSFLNYLVHKGRFYSFLNTDRRTISRLEFEDYCRWVSEKLDNTSFGKPVRSIEWKGERFLVRLDSGSFTARHLCIGTGKQASVPSFARQHIGERCFHAKSPQLRTTRFDGKRVIVVGGGQTGAEIFLNSLRGMFGEARSVHWISRRLTLEALDESAFVNDYFTPHYAKAFFELAEDKKRRIVAAQKLTSDGITPDYLLEIYRELYDRSQSWSEGTAFELLPGREVVGLDAAGEEWALRIRNEARDAEEIYPADIVVLATGFAQSLPPCLEPLLGRLERDGEGRPRMNAQFQINWDGPATAKIYAVNFGRHSHGIAEAQTSLMAWRSATILNDLLGREHFERKDAGAGFIQH